MQSWAGVGWGAGGGVVDQKACYCLLSNLHGSGGKWFTTKVLTLCEFIYPFVYVLDYKERGREGGAPKPEILTDGDISLTSMDKFCPVT